MCGSVNLSEIKLEYNIQFFSQFNVFNKKYMNKELIMTGIFILYNPSIKSNQTQLTFNNSAEN